MIPHEFQKYFDKMEHPFCRGRSTLRPDQPHVEIKNKKGPNKKQGPGNLGELPQGRIWQRVVQGVVWLSWTVSNIEFHFFIYKMVQLSNTTPFPYTLYTTPSPNTNPRVVYKYLFILFIKRSSLARVVYTTLYPIRPSKVG